MRQYIRQLAPRAWRALWSPTAKFFTGSATVLTLIAFLNQPLLSLISTTWQGIPWWLGFVVLVPLLFYALIRASYDEYRAATEPRTGSDGAGMAPQPQLSRELEQLEKRLRRTEQERDDLRTRLSDPTAMRRREEERLRQRCADLALEVRNFSKAHRTQYETGQEIVERFRRRHYSEVVELRDELDQRGKLTAEERESLILRAHDGPEKIKHMADVIGFIAAGW